MLHLHIYCSPYFRPRHSPFLYSQIHVPRLFFKTIILSLKYNKIFSKHFVRTTLHLCKHNVDKQISDVTRNSGNKHAHYAIVNLFHTAVKKTPRVPYKCPASIIHVLIYMGKLETFSSLFGLNVVTVLIVSRMCSNVYIYYNKDDNIHKSMAQ